VLSRADAGGYDATLVDVSTSALTDVGQLAEDLDEDAGVLRDAGLDADVASEGLLIDFVLDQLRSSQITSLGFTLVASMLILSLVFWVRERKPMLGVLAIAAVGIVVAWVLGLMAIFGIPFNVMTAMVSALAIGIGVPFGIHVVNRFLEDRTRYASLEEAVRQTLLHTGGALVGSAITTIAGFGVLALSTVRPMKQFGIVTAMTIGLALLSSIAVLPAMLAIWSKRHDWSDEPSVPAGASDDEIAPAPAGRQP
jgi:predicted RND superfamily exporter protein